MKYIKHESLSKLKCISDNQGMTLMELIIAMTFISIIALASFSGIRFAYMAFTSSDAYMADAYDSQLDFENQLSYIFTHLDGTVAADISEEAVSDPMTFEWGNFSGSTWVVDTTSPMDEFDVNGVTVTRISQEGEYLEESINAYIPLDTTPTVSVP